MTTRAQLQKHLTERALRLARLTDAEVTHVNWDVPIAGGLYLHGQIHLGLEISEMLEVAIAGDQEALWQVGRVIAHEVAHGRNPRSAGALEEAIVETIARHDAGWVLADLCWTPEADDIFWRECGVYRPLVRWWEQVAALAGSDPVTLAIQIKHGRPHPWRDAAREQRRTLGAFLCGDGGDSRDLRIGRAVAASAGLINGEGPHRPPRSPAVALRQALTTLERARPHDPRSWAAGSGPEPRHVWTAPPSRPDRPRSRRAQQ